MSVLPEEIIKTHISGIRARISDSVGLDKNLYL